MPKTMISLRLDDDLLSIAQNAATQQRTSVSYVITQAISAYFNVTPPPREPHHTPTPTTPPNMARYITIPNNTETKEPERTPFTDAE